VAESEAVEERVGYLLKMTQQALHGAMERALRGVGLTVSEYAALSLLAEHPDLSNAELARQSFVTPQTMNELLRKLETRGLIERRAHAAHARILPARLTSPGQALLAAGHERVRCIESRMVAGLAPGERAQLRAALRRCRAALADDSARPNAAERGSSC
jgi:DNA-binding MarR family transcriptional regulator